MQRRDLLKFLFLSTGMTVYPCAHALLPTSTAGDLAEGLGEAEDSPQAHAASSIASTLPMQWLPLGQVKPAGWIREQMLNDLHEGYAGHLGELCHEVSSGIFVEHRNSLHSQNRANIDNNNWWNGEAEGNWRNGHLMMAYLTGDPGAMAQADAFVKHILANQESEGYLGVFAPDLRFSRPGELWTQTCLMRGLLAYYEFTGDDKVLSAVRRAVDLTISKYGERYSPIPFDYTISGEGLSHDLMFSDLTELLYSYTGDRRYLDFTVHLYEALSRDKPGADTSLASLLKADAPFVNHGANTFEAMRVPLWLSVATARPDLAEASANSLRKLLRYTEVSGSAVSGEDIKDLPPDPSTTLYEYCATKEIQFTLQSALQKHGSAELADHIENIWFNAAQASRLPNGKALTYLTSDNRLHCDGLLPDGSKKEKKNKFSPAHTDSAVCCNPNSTQVAPLFVRGMWMRAAQGGLVAALYGPCTVSTQVNGTKVSIEEKTAYPFDFSVELHVRAASATRFPIYLRNPSWSQSSRVECHGAKVERLGDYWRVEKAWGPQDKISVRFHPTVRSVRAVNGEMALQYGPLLFAQPIPAEKTSVKQYPLPSFEDAYFLPKGPIESLSFTRSSGDSFGFSPHVRQATEEVHMPFQDPPISLEGKMKRDSDGAAVPVTLVPLGSAAILRRLTFPAV